MNNDMKPLQVELSLQDLNRILEALGHLPYIQVFGLIESLRTQAIGQLQNPQAVAAEPELALN